MSELRILGAATSSAIVADMPALRLGSDWKRTVVDRAERAPIPAWAAVGRRIIGVGGPSTGVRHAIHTTLTNPRGWAARD